MSAQQNRRREAGSILIWALLLLGSAGAITANVVMRHRTTMGETRVDSTRLSRLYAAEAGIELARTRLAQNPNWSGETIDLDKKSVQIQVRSKASGWTVVARCAGVRIDVELDAAQPLPRVARWRARP